VIERTGVRLTVLSTSTTTPRPRLTPVWSTSHCPSSQMSSPTRPASTVLVAMLEPRSRLRALGSRPPWGLSLVT